MQGSFALHGRSLEKLGIEAVEIRRARQLEGLSGLIIPGGESTTFHIVMSEDDFLEHIKGAIREGLPTWGTCAGAIMLGRGEGIPAKWGMIGVEVARNSYGRQIASFVAPIQIEGFDRPFDGVFIRAPRFVAVEPSVNILARYQSEPVMARERAIIVTSFHPELTDDLRVHRFFVEKICGGS